jgi:DNA-binding XRE family transcriptional regulator
MSRPKPDEEDLRERKLRQIEWREFRRNYLFTQTKLAGILGISRRTVQKIEAAQVTPYAETLRRFKTLQAKHEGAS